MVLFCRQPTVSISRHDEDLHLLTTGSYQLFEPSLYDVFHWYA